MMNYTHVVDWLMGRRAILILALVLSGCDITVNQPLSSDDLRHTGAQQREFDVAFPNCRVAANIILSYAKPVDGEEYRERLNASDRALIECMAKLGYPYRPRGELLLPWHD